MANISGFPISFGCRCPFPGPAFRVTQPGIAIWRTFFPLIAFYFYDDLVDDSFFHPFIFVHINYACYKLSMGAHVRIRASNDISNSRSFWTIPAWIQMFRAQFQSFCLNWIFIKTHCEAIHSNWSGVSRIDRKLKTLINKNINKFNIITSDVHLHTAYTARSSRANNAKSHYIKCWPGGRGKRQMKKSGHERKGKIRIEFWSHIQIQCHSLICLDRNRSNMRTEFKI